MALSFCLEGLGTRAQDLQRLLKELRLDDAQLRPVGDHPLVLRPLLAAAGQEVRDLLLAVDDLARVELVRQDAADRVLAPVAAALGFDPAGVETVCDLRRTEAVLRVPAVDLADDLRLLRVDCKIKVVALGLVVAEDDVRHAALLGIDLLAEFDALGGIRALLLRQRTEDREDEFGVAHAGHVRRQKLRLDAEGLELADVLQQVHGVAREAGDVLHHDHVEQPALRVLHHAEEFLAVFDLRPGEPLVGIESDEVVPRTLGVLGKKRLLRLQTVELVLLIRGDPAISGNVHGVSLPV